MSFMAAPLGSLFVVFLIRQRQGREERAAQPIYPLESLRRSLMIYIGLSPFQQSVRLACSRLPLAIIKPLPFTWRIFGLFFIGPFRIVQFDW